MKYSKLNKLNTHKDLLEYILNTVDLNDYSDNPDTQNALLDYLFKLSIKVARDDFYTFVKLMMPSMIPGEFKDNIHIKIMCDEYQKVYENIINKNPSGKKLRVSVPPGSSKTLIGSILFPIWCLGKNPRWRVLAVAHSTKHAERFLGKPAKALVKTSEYRAIFPKFNLDAESKAGAHWSTNKGGYYAAFGVGASIAGKRANITICDDVVSEQTAYSTAEKKAINDWYIPGLRTRLLPNGGEINILTRWALDDIAGYIEEVDKDTDPWKVISIPAILDEETIDLFRDYQEDLSKEYKAGDSYWPSYRTLDWLLNMKGTMPAFQWSALYQQSPIPEEGTIFKHDKFQLWLHPEPPEVSNVIISLDTAFSTKDTKDAAYSAYSIWGIFPKVEITSKGDENIVGNMILLGNRKGRWGFPELCSLCQSLWEEYRDTLDFFLVEDMASGQSLIQELQARGIPVVPYKPEKDKISRAWAAAAILEQDRIYVNPNLTPTQEFLGDILSFPHGDSKDMTDTFTQAVLWMRDNWHIIPQGYSSYDLEYGEHGNNPNFQRRSKSYWDSVTKH
jgi:predicted phage terminase large subunit-like protein